MKEIVYITSSPVPSRKANAVHTQHICQAFSDIGLRVRLICRSSPAARDTDKLRDWVGVKGKVHALPSWMIGGKSALVVYAIWAVCISAIFAGRRGRIYSRDVLTCWMLTRLRIGHVLELHGLVNRKVMNYILAKVVNSRYCYRIVVINQALGSEVSSRYGVRPSKISVVPDAASPNPWAGLQKVRSGVITYTGSLYPGKGIDIIVNVARHMPSRTFEIIGGPEEIWDANYRDKAGSNVRYLGWCEHAEVLMRQASAEILLLPNQEQVLVNNGKDDIGPYTSPLKLFEYMSAGRPIVASDLPAIREVVDDSAVAFSPPTSISGWIQAIERITSNEDYQRQIVAESNRRFTSSFTWKRRAERIRGLMP